MPGRVPLSQERVLRAALEIVDRDGLEALSMRRLGAELGVEAMSLYNHVPSKAVLLDGIYEQILEETGKPRARGTWLDQARHQARALRRALLAHPNAVSLFATRSAATPAALARLEVELAIL